MSQAELVSPASMRSDSGQEQQQQEVLMVTIDDYNYKQGLGAAIATAPSFQQHAGGLDMVTVTF
jgi:transcription factor TGA